MSEPLAIPRHVRLWEYTVSHRFALLRAPSSRSEPENLDLIFTNVSFLDLPTSLPVGALLSECGPDEIAEFESRLGPLEPEARLFCIITPSHRYHVAAATWELQTNQRDIFDSGIRPFSPEASFHTIAHSAPRK